MAGVQINISIVKTFQQDWKYILFKLSQVKALPAVLETIFVMLKLVAASQSLKLPAAEESR